MNKRYKFLRLNPKPQDCKFIWWFKSFINKDNILQKNTLKGFSHTYSLSSRIEKLDILARTEIKIPSTASMEANMPPIYSFGQYCLMIHA